ncbi:hypothetical protein QBC38DRAFT_92828 [Podospora fimiseda]|uniref:Uncharacterized protein n=1 Tax=Podospora fimiseda TaxID=252190 RepID=A0AAN7BZ44_9PEZI|nr:hypothetical protein QBC38DRAFT_92828 [Podospora fimiseda]
MRLPLRARVSKFGSISGSKGSKLREHYRVFLSQATYFVFSLLGMLFGLARKVQICGHLIRGNRARHDLDVQFATQIWILAASSLGFVFNKRVTNLGREGDDDWYLLGVIFCTW